MRNLKHISILVAFLMQMVGWNAYSSGQVCMFDYVIRDYDDYNYTIVRYQGRYRAIDRNKKIILPFAYDDLIYNGDGTFIGRKNDTSFVPTPPHNYMSDCYFSTSEYLVDSTGKILVESPNIWNIDGTIYTELYATISDVERHDLKENKRYYLGRSDEITNVSSEHYMRCIYHDKGFHNAIDDVKNGRIYSSCIDTCGYCDKNGNWEMLLTDCSDISWVSPIEDGHVLVISTKYYMLYENFRLKKKLKRKRVDGIRCQSLDSLDIDYESIQYSEGNFILPRKGMETILINTQGKYVDLKKRIYGSFLNGYVVAKSTKGYTIIDEKGNDMLRASYDDIEWCSSVNDTSYFRVKKEGKQMVVRYDGLILPYSEIGNGLYEGRLMVKKNGGWGYVDQKWKEVIECHFEEMGPFFKGYAVVKRDGKWGIIDVNGAVKIECMYDKCQLFCEGYAAVKRDWKWGFIDLNGTEKIECTYDDCHWFFEGMAAVMKDGKWFFIDKRGEVICFSLPSEKIKEQGAK